MRSRQLLDQVQSLPRIATLEEDPSAYADRVAEELPEDAAARDAHLREALARIDALAERIMRIRLDHALDDDPSIGVPTRKVFASTVARYADALDVLETRARDVAARGGSPDYARAGRLVADAAHATLSLRRFLRDGVLAIVAAVAAQAVPVADANARDRRLEDAPRKAWSAQRREWEAVAAHPQRIEAAPLDARLQTWPEEIDEPDPAAEPTFADMIELD